jgi:endoglucanase
MPSSLGSPTKTSSPDHTDNPVRFVYTISEAGRLLPSASRWNSIEIDFNLIPQSATAYDSLPSRYSKSVDYDLIITDREYFKRFIYISVSIALAILLLILLIHFLPHKHAHNASSQNLTFAVNQALTFFDAQKCNTMHSIKYI